MRTFKAVALSAVAVFVLVAAPVSLVKATQANPQLDAGSQLGASGSAVAAEPTCNRLSAANSAGQEIFLSTPNNKEYPTAGQAWQNVNCTNTTFRLKYGERALVTADFSAEADCNGPTTGQWCQTRALLNGTEMRPVASEPDSFAFDNTAGGSQNWQAHKMQRGWEIRCGLTQGCQYGFVVQTRMHAPNVTMWLDEVTVDLRVTIGALAAS